MTWGPWRELRDMVLRAPDAPWSATERLVALAVGDCMDEAGSAQLSTEKIASRTGLVRRTVQRALARLTAPGGIFDEDEGGSTLDGGRRASVYTLTTRAMVTPVPASQGRRSADQTRVMNDTDPRHRDAVRTMEGLDVPRNVARTAARAVRQRSGGNAAGGWPRRLAGLWGEVLGGILAPGRVGKALSPLVAKHGEALVTSGWHRYLKEGRSRDREERRFLSPEDFGRRFADFAPEARPPEPAPEPAATGPVLGASRDEMERARAEGRQWW